MLTVTLECNGDTSTITVTPVSKPAENGSVAYEVEAGTWRGLVVHRPDDGPLKLLETVLKAARR